MTFSQKLLKLAEPYVEACVQKPFLIEAANGTLPLDKFQYYLKIDYPYLINYNRVLALGVAKTKKLETMQVMVDLLVGNVKEISNHQNFAKRFGVSLEDMSGQRLGPVKYSYTRHELSVAHSGSLAELMVTMLPCMWGYGEVARQVVSMNPVSPDNPFKDWITYYTTTEYDQLGVDCMRLIDVLTKESKEDDLRQMEGNFHISFTYEVMCWDAYYTKEEWPTMKD